MARYLRWGRPACATRRVFVRTRAPRVGFASSVAIDGIVARPWHGPVSAPVARRALAPPFAGRGDAPQRGLIGRDWPTVGTSLAQSTEIYAKVDERALADLAQPWPGGAP